jgi:hypothetical protein
MPKLAKLAALIFLTELLAHYTYGAAKLGSHSNRL